MGSQRVGHDWVLNWTELNWWPVKLSTLLKTYWLYRSILGSAGLSVLLKTYRGKHRQETHKSLQFFFFFCNCHLRQRDFPCSSISKESTCNAGDPGLILGFERSPGEVNGYQLQYSCLINPMDKGVWQVTVHGVTGYSPCCFSDQNNTT